MIPNLVTDTTLSGSLGGKTKQMGIDQNSIAHIMTVLTDLYSDAERAVIREYSTNALDAHRDAGTTRPIEVTTPSTFNPYFKVKDFGVGLTANEIQDVYAMYGASTKRGSNDTVGMLGLGSKSALTYTKQFTVVAVKNGVKTSVAIYRTEDGTGTSEVVDTVATNEPNGVEIVVPVANRNSFEQKAAEFFKYWAKGTVLVNGVPPKSALDDLTEIEPGLYVHKGSGNYYDEDESCVVMGNVAYPIENFHNKFSPRNNYRLHRYSMIAFVPIGAVNFTPSREALNYTALTNQTIRDAAKRFFDGLERAAKDEILSAPNATEAWKAWDGWRNTFNFQNLAYNGMVFVDQVAHPHTEYDLGAYRNAVGSSSMFPLRVTHTALFVHNYSNASLTATNKKKIRKYLDDNGLRATYKRVVLSVNKPNSVWLQNVPLVDFADITAVKLPSNKTGTAGGSRKQVGYDFVTNVNGTVTRHWQEPLPAKLGQVLYMSPTSKEVNPSNLLTALPEHATIVTLGMNRWDKFKRQHPKAEHVKAYARRRMAELTQVTDEYRKFVGISGVTKSLLLNVDPTKVDDPDIVAMAEFAQTFKPNESNLGRARNIGSAICVYPPQVQPIPYELEKQYPLLSAARYSVRESMDHILLYINAAYQANNSKGSN